MESKQEDYFENMVAALAKPGEEIIEEMTPHKAHIMHMAVGVSGEAGELLDAIKKNVFYNKAVDMKNVVEELGDLEFYMEGLRRALSITREQTIQANIEKLGKRYEDGVYTNKHADLRLDKA